MPQGRKAAISSDQNVRAEEAAEKGLVLGGVHVGSSAGAEAQSLFCGACGTTEVVPCYKEESGTVLYS